MDGSGDLLFKTPDLPPFASSLGGGEMGQTVNYYSTCPTYISLPGGIILSIEIH